MEDSAPADHLALMRQCVSANDDVQAAVAALEGTVPHITIVPVAQ